VFLVIAWKEAAQSSYSRGAGGAPSAQVRALRDRALQPGLPSPIQFLDLRPLQARHVAFHPIADLLLRIGEMTIPNGERVQLFSVQRQPCGRINWIEPILLIGRLTQNKAPGAATLFQKIVEAPGADDIA
jgi:hypothetical protein